MRRVIAVVMAMVVFLAALPMAVSAESVWKNGGLSLKNRNRTEKVLLFLWKFL